MTERRTPYVADPTEAEVQAQVVERLEAAGWFVAVTSRIRKVRGGDYGVPDLLAFRDDCTLLVETKRPGGKLRLSQHIFAREVEPHLGEHLHYVLAYWPDDVERWSDE